MLAERIMSSLLFGPVLLWAAWVGGWLLLAVVALLTLVAHSEMAGMLRHRDIRLLPWTGPVGMGLLLAAAHWGTGEQLAGTLVLVALLPLVVLLGRPGTFTLADAAFTTMTILYIGGLASYLVRLRLLGEGQLLLVALILTWSYDTAAYFAGRAWGRHKLVPRLSPQKSWEGALGGAITTLAFAVLLSQLGLLELPVALGAGALVTVFAQVGDLIESAIKRYVEVKDAGQIIPGHGGVLDRFDSLFLTGFALYFYFLVVLG